MLRGLILALSLVPASAGAQVLWRNVEAGMPASRVQKLYPDIPQNSDTVLIGPVERVGGCSAAVRIAYANDVVDSVIVESDPSMDGATCADGAQALLLRRHGEPDDVSEYDSGPNRRARAQSWTRKKLRIEFVREGGTIGLAGPCISISCQLQPPSAFGDRNAWKIIYRAAKADAGAAGR